MPPMKRVPVLVFLAACASGRAPSPSPDNNGGDDAPNPPRDAPVPIDTSEPMDAPLPLDAPPHIDAAPPDAASMPDACVKVAQEKLLNPVFDLAPTGVNWTEVPIQNLP